MPLAKLLTRFVLHGPHWMPIQLRKLPLRLYARYLELRAVLLPGLR